MSNVEQWLLTETLNEWSQLSESERLIKGDETRQQVRSLLAGLPSQQLLSLIFSARSPLGSHPLISELREKNHRRRDLLQTVYGDKWRAIESTYVRLPSEQKRLLVELLVSRMKKRYRWFSSPLLHAYAFRPRGFRPWEIGVSSQPKERIRCSGRRVHPLYSRVEITRRPGNPRILYVPAPPLKRLQRELLGVCLDPAMSTMPASVMGCRRNDNSKSYGIFKNASAHLGQQFVAKFDLKDFFPSVQIADVVETLQRLKTPMFSHLDEEHGTLIEVPWTHDAAVLVSRLVTRFGHLPQGAPTSPAIANLVFARLDREIEDRFGSSIVYTRYVDDLTFSVSRQVAAKLGIDSSADFLAMVQPIVRKVLEPTSFSLNDRKTRVSDLRGGHSVTGLSVGKSQVNLPRETRRHLRGLLHRIGRDGVVSVAEAQMGAERFAELSEWTSAVLGGSAYGKPAGHGEAMIAAFIRSLCPNLVVEIPEQTFAVGTKRVIRDCQLHEGKVAVKDCMFLLPPIWTGELAIHSDGGHFQIRRTQDDHYVASIRAERNLELFALSCRQFHAVLNLWSHLRGWSAGLSTPPGDNCFSDVSRFRGTIQTCVDQFRLHLPAQSVSDSIKTKFESNVSGLSSGFSLQPNVNRLRESTQQIYLILNEIVYDVDGSVIGSFNHFCREIEVPADDKDALRDWFANARKYWQLVPRFKNEALNKEVNHMHLQINVLHERLSGDRSPVYELENSLLSSACRKHTVESLSSGDCNHVQLAVLKAATQVLQMMRQDQRASENASLAAKENSTPQGLESMLHEAVDGLTEAHERAMWKETNTRMFNKTATERLRRGRLKLAAPIQSCTTEQAWDALADFAKELVRWTTDSLSFTKQIFSEAVKRDLEKSKAKVTKKNAYRQVFYEVGDGKKVLEILYRLRNHAAHGDSSRRKQEMRHVERYAASLLGKRFGKRSNPKNSLQLTATEATEVKLEILKQVRLAIESIQQTQ